MSEQPPATSPVGDARGSAALLPWVVVSEELVRPVSGGPAPPPLSLIERVSAPTIFIHQALVFEQALDGARLRQALASALALFPTLACRATMDEDGEWALCHLGAGAPLTLGTSSASASRLAPRPPLPPSAPLVALGEELFGHLPNLPADGDGAAVLPLVHLALVTTLDGSCLLGLRVSHLVADFGTLRGLLHHLAREYNGQPLAATDKPTPAQPLVAALGALPPPPGARLQNYLPVPPAFDEVLAALAAQPPLQGLTLHVSPARLAALKAQAVAEAKATVGAERVGEEDAWVSTNAALMAWLWRTLAALPCRRGAVVPFHQALDIRRRLAALPEAALAACEGVDARSRWLYGNLAASALTPALDAAAMPMGSVALQLRRTVARDAAQFATDVALLAAGDTSGAVPRPPPATLRAVLEVVTERAAGRPTLIMTSQLILDYEVDASFDGQVPVGAACTFGRVLVPVVHTQQAPPAAGGGVLLYCWLPHDEAHELVAAVAAQPHPA